MSLNVQATIATLIVYVLPLSLWIAWLFRKDARQEKAMDEFIAQNWRI